VPSPSAAPTKTACQIIDGPTNDFGGDDVEIEDDDCKLWKVTGLIKSLTVASTSAAEVEGVDVTFGPGGGFSGTLGQRLFLAVGAKGGEATNTNIVARSVRDIDVGKNSGVATNTYIAVKDSVDERGIFVARALRPTAATRDLSNPPFFDRSATSTAKPPTRPSQSLVP
jgi:hypothetical protein